MPLLSLTRRLDNQGIADRLRREQKELRATSFAFFDIEFDQDIASSLINVFRESSRLGRVLSELSLYFCPGNEFVDQVLEVAVNLDIFLHFHIKGNNNTNHPTRAALLMPPAVNNRRAPADAGEVERQELPNPRQQEQDVLLPSRPSLRPFGLTLQFCRNIRRLQLSCLTLTREDVETLRRGLKDHVYNYNNTHQKAKDRLEKLSISNALLQEGALEQLAGALHENNSLQDLALVNCALTDEQVERVVQSLHRHASLTTLRLYGNQCQERGLHSIVSWLSQPDCILQSLQISHQNLRRRLVGAGNNARTSIEHITTGIQLKLEHFAQNWEHVYSRNQNSDDTRRENTTAHNKSLKHLRLYGNNLGDEDMLHIGALLKRLTSLEELDLDSNNITNKGLANFAESSACLSPPGHLRVLRLSGNNLTADSAHSLLKILKIHPELESVTSNDFWKKTEHENEIRQFLDINGAGRVLLLYVHQDCTSNKCYDGYSGVPVISRVAEALKSHRSSPHVPLALWPLVFARVNRGTPMVRLNFGCKDKRKAANGIFYLLRHGPILFDQRHGREIANLSFGSGGRKRRSNSPVNLTYPNSLTTNETLLNKQKRARIERL